MHFFLLIYSAPTRRRPSPISSKPWRALNGIPWVINMRVHKLITITPISRITTKTITGLCGIGWKICMTCETLKYVFVWCGFTLLCLTSAVILFDMRKYTLIKIDRTSVFVFLMRLINQINEIILICLRVSTMKFRLLWLDLTSTFAFHFHIFCFLNSFPF